MEREELLKKLVAIRYERNDIAFERNMFRVRGDTVEIFPAYWKDSAIRVEFFGDEIDRICEINAVTGAVHTGVLETMWPSSPPPTMSPPRRRWTPPSRRSGRSWRSG